MSTLTNDKPKHAGVATTAVVKVSLSMDLLLENAFAWIQTNITATKTITRRMALTAIMSVPVTQIPYVVVLLATMVSRIAMEDCLFTKLIPQQLRQPPSRPQRQRLQLQQKCHAAPKVERPGHARMEGDISNTCQILSNLFDKLMRPFQLGVLIFSEIILFLKLHSRMPMAAHFVQVYQISVTDKCCINF